jgi:hypothetical protein
MNDGGLVIDLSAMRSVHVDPAGQTVRAEGGCTWGDVDRETQLFGLATPGGLISITGIGGLTLHGGLGLVRLRLPRARDAAAVDVGSRRVRWMPSHTFRLSAFTTYASCRQGHVAGMGSVTISRECLHVSGPDEPIVFPLSHPHDVEGV